MFLSININNSHIQSSNSRTSMRISVFVAKYNHDQGLVKDPSLTTSSVKIQIVKKKENKNMMDFEN